MTKETVEEADAPRGAAGSGGGANGMKSDEDDVSFCDTKKCFFCNYFKY
jgi:hypothetical protein